MEHRDIVMRILKTNGECSHECFTDDCPFSASYTTKPCHTSIQRFYLAKEWLESNGGTMNKLDAIRRLDAIEKEQAELRKIIEKGDKIVYKESKIYCIIYNGMPFIFAGHDRSKYFRFHKFTSSEFGFNGPFKSGQECVDDAIEVGATIHVFDDTKEALQFFIDHL